MSPPAAAFTFLPFAVTFLIVGTVAIQRLFPLLSNNKAKRSEIPWVNASPFGHSTSASGASRKPSIHTVAAISFSITLGLSAVLVELLLCEISDALDPVARSSALKFTISCLLLLLIIVTPALELGSIISALGWKFTDAGKGRLRVAWGIEILGLMLWLFGFWWAGAGLLDRYQHLQGEGTSRRSLSEGALERISVIGISLMASLAGFAAISSLWHTFGMRAKKVTETDIARKQAGIDATNEMLAAKESRLRALNRKMSDTPQAGFMGRMIGAVRGNPDVQERKALELEIAGLETMRSSLSNSLYILQSRHQSQVRSKTTVGRICNLANYVFALYCLYRIGATTLVAIRRWSNPDTTFSNSDPINNILALIAKHWDPSLDRAAWSRQISFLLSGVMLLASFNAVVQTVLLFSRFAPSVLQHARENLALLVSQICATYVISSALLLRSNLPKEMSSVITEALGAPLEPRFVDRWFEAWFLSVSALTAVGIFLSRKIGGSGDWDDDVEKIDVEMGKMS